MFPANELEEYGLWAGWDIFGQWRKGKAEHTVLCRKGDAAKFRKFCSIPFDMLWQEIPCQIFSKMNYFHKDELVFFRFRVFHAETFYGNGLHHLVL